MAATEEFAQYRIAGARGDRITKAADGNNALLQRYFGSKVELLDTAHSRLVTEIVDWPYTRPTRQGPARSPRRRRTGSSPTRCPPGNPVTSCSCSP
ncbi:TetR/AcrR family transcriptional regulator [Streptomyces sp. NPDC002405]|uniref:TetR/AcrR family transcriptional regulator n=1 Tax=unclassified Streptomyces TaxID=2593676 RepID=UPI00369C600A